ncbi:MAG: outer membrane beta-barrel protein [Muribaculaceae bacterium]|nr:outer membrane beta-barrel protein [Muribaculaceae bacterium]
MKHRYYLIMTLSLVVFSFFPSNADDSIPATDLQELVVKSERSWIENGVINIIPTKKEKQLSTSPGSLIEILHLPMLKGKDDAITTSNDEPVDIFINGEPATQSDLATFWPKTVKKVEYMINPTGEQYTGRRHVVNFVVADYAVGGVTKINVRQSVPVQGLYSISSKLNYKKMSYGLLFNGVNKRNPANKTQEEATYRNIFYNGERYEEIKQISTGESNNKYTTLNLAFNARYTTQKFKATHTLGLRWNHDITDASNSNLWSEDLFNSKSFSSFSKLKSLSPQLSGQYFIKLSGKWEIGAQWAYAYSSNDNADWSQFGDNPRIENGMKEKVNTLSGRVYANYYLTRKMILQLSANTSNHWFSADYSGSSTESCNQFRDEWATKLSLYWYPSPMITFVLTPGINQSIYHFSDMKVKHTNPTVYAYGSWNPSRRLSMYLNLSTHFLPGSAGETNPVLTKLSDLKWVTGNPDLKPEVRLLGIYSLLYMPFDRLSLNPSLIYSHYQNSVYAVYAAAPEEMGGVIQTNANASPFDDFLTDLNVSVYLLNNRLSLTAAPRIRFFKARGEYAGSLTNFSMTASVGFSIGDFYLSADYQSKNKVLAESGSMIVSQADQYSLSARYSWKDLNIGLSVRNMFKSRFKTQSEMLSNVYGTDLRKSYPGRGATLSLTYTFGYGKKVDSTIDIAEPTEVESSHTRASKN